MPDLGDGNTFDPNPNDKDDCNHDTDPRPDSDENWDPRSDENEGQGSGPDHDRPDFGGGVSNIPCRGNTRIADLDLDELAHVATFPKHIHNLLFIQALRNASLDDDIGLTGNALHRLRNPLHESLEPDLDAKLALSIFFALKHSSEESYERIWHNIHEWHPDTSLPSFYHIKQILADFSRVTPLVNDMCINSCTVFVGPYAHLDWCPECNEARYDQMRLENSGGDIKALHAVFNTIPITPQLQALWWHPESAQKMWYWEQWTQVIFTELQENDGFVKTYDDVFCSSTYLDAVHDQKILPTDMLLMLLIDGVQIYEKKESDCWIYI